MSAGAESTIQGRVVECIRRVLPRRRRDVGIEPTSRLADLMDSLVLIELLTSLEKEFTVRLSADRLRAHRMDTVSDVTSLVTSLTAPTTEGE